MNIDFENRLKPLIEEARARGVTDVDMEVAMILPVHSINRWFRGVNKSYDRYADRIADYFDVSKHYLYGIDAEKPVPTDGNGLNDREKLVLSLFNRLPASNQEGVIAQLQGLVQFQEAQDARSKSE